MRRWLLLPLLLLCLLAGTAQARSKKDKMMDQILLDYAATLRWNGFEQGIAFIDPEVRATRPISSIDLNRYRQVRVSYYRPQSPVQVSKTEIQVLAEIGIINNHNQSERSIIDRQTWRWDEKQKRWWLMSGLPTITSAPD
ncbi:MAG: hypothetical protein JNN30_08285 [Rhodanobacteraceae bacterium]|nr:hypothetical protein [Rhodanobacteraceae bacterium]